MRLLAGTLLLAGCSPAGMSAAAEDDLIECALGSADAFVRECRVERSRVGETLFLTVHHPDGGFRRFEVLSDGRGLAAADGAQQARVSAAESGVEAAIGRDRYRFPATNRDVAAGE